jgi:threonyl-tRNA synthetase
MEMSVSFVEDLDRLFYSEAIMDLQDSIGRKWQCSTIQLDFNLPERFDMEYVDKENTRQRPIMIHRAVLGSVERFFGILTEDCAGAFPAWLAPMQCRVLPVNTACEEHCYDFVTRMKQAGIRADMVCCVEYLAIRDSYRWLNFDTYRALSFSSITTKNNSR